MQKDGTDSDMYEVEEIYAPDGYEKSDKTLTFKGKVINDTKENLIHDVKAENNTDNDTTTYVHDSDTFSQPETGLYCIEEDMG